VQVQSAAAEQAAAKKKKKDSHIARDPRFETARTTRGEVIDSVPNLLTLLYPSCGPFTKTSFQNGHTPTSGPSHRTRTQVHNPNRGPSSVV
jgi:hypothetical protein